MVKKRAVARIELGAGGHVIPFAGQRQVQGDCFAMPPHEQCVRAFLQGFPAYRQYYQQQRAIHLGCQPADVRVEWANPLEVLDFPLQVGLPDWTPEPASDDE